MEAFIIKDTYNISSVEKSLNILQFFIGKSEESSATAISRALDIPYPTCFRLLSTLESSGFLYKNPETLKYSIGPSAIRLSEGFSVHHYIRDFAIPYLNRLRDMTGESAVLYCIKSVRQNLRICIGRVDSGHRLRTVTKENDELVLAQGASGLVLIAFLSAKDREYLKAVSPSLDLDLLDEIRAQGHAVSINDRVEGVAGIAVPVFGRDGSVAASLGISGASSRFAAMDADTIASHLELLKSFSAQITENISAAD